MSGKNKSAYPFYIIAGTLVCLVALSLVKNSFSFHDFTTRPLDLLADVRKDAPEDIDTDSALIAADLPEDTTNTAAVDSLGAEMPVIPDPDHLHNFATYTGIINYLPPVGADTTVKAGLQHFLLEKGEWGR